MRKIGIVLFAILIALLGCERIVFAEESQEEMITIIFETREDSPQEEWIYVKIHPGETVKFPDVPDKIDGDVFIGWYAVYEDYSSAKVDESTMFYKNAFVSPSYVPILSADDAEIAFRETCYTVTLESGIDDDGRDNIIYVDLDETENLYTLIDQAGWNEPKREGYIFLGWYTEEKGGLLIDQNTYVTSDMIIYAHWKIDDGIYKMILYKNYEMNATGMYKILWGKKVPKLPKLKRKGYIFKGWYSSHYDEDSVFEVHKGDKLKGSLCIYAHWKKINIKKASIKKVKEAGKNKIKVSIKKVKNADGYQIMCSKNKKFKKKTSKTYTSKKTAKTIKIKKNMKYIKVRAYRIDSAGKKVYGKWSKAKKIKKK